jgi:hypothetical protein
MALQVGGSLESETVKHGHEERLHWRGPAAIVNDRPTLSSERKLHTDYDRKGSVEKEFLVVSLNRLGAKTN